MTHLVTFYEDDMLLFLLLRCYVQENLSVPGTRSLTRHWPRSPAWPPGFSTTPRSRSTSGISRYRTSRHWKSPITKRSLKLSYRQAARAWVNLQWASCLVEYKIMWCYDVAHIPVGLQLLTPCVWGTLLQYCEFTVGKLQKFESLYCHAVSSLLAVSKS